MLQRTISMFAAIVVFFTTYALVLPAITMEKTAGCGIEEHQHDDSCYEDQLICGLEETEEHQHTADCYERVLVCGKEAHTHSAACYPAETEVEVDAGVNDNAGNTDDAGDGVDTSVETTEGGETDVPASDSSDATVVIDPSDPSGQVTDGQVTDPVVTEDPAALVDDPAAAVAYPAVIFDDTINVLSAGLNTDTEIGTESGLQTLADETSLFVHVEADEETFPEGTTMVLSEVTDDTIDTVATAVEGALSARDAAANAQQAEAVSQAQTRTRGFHALDISFYDLEGNKIEPLRPVRVSITSDAIRTAVQDETTVPVVVHVEDQTAQTAVSDNAGGAADATETAGAGSDAALNSTVVEAAETTEAAATGKQDAAADAAQTLDTLTFEAGAFSVYAIVYTVDFHWEVDGKSYDFSIPGGGYVSLYDLVKDLGIAEDKADTEKDEIRELVDGVETIEFSNPELVSVSRTEENTTVGAIKDGLGLDCEYSTDLTEKQIAEINAQEVLAGDWALISLKPFDTEESMTVTMINGETWTVKVTDAQISRNYMSASGKLYTVTLFFDDNAQIPENSHLEVKEFAEGSEDYVSAKAAVMEKKRASGEDVEKDIIGFDAFDITIVSPEGTEIEPQSPVNVSISMKRIPENVDPTVFAESLEVQHLIEDGESTDVQVVMEAGNTIIEEDYATMQFNVESFSTYTITWSAVGSDGLNGVRISNISSGRQYIIYAKDTNGNYYALKHDGTAVQVAGSDGISTYTGNQNDLKWTVTHNTYNDTYTIYYKSNNTNYYLNAGNAGNRVAVSWNNNTTWQQWSDYLYSAYNTFLQSNRGTFRVRDVTNEGNWGSNSLVFFSTEFTVPTVEETNVTVHYGYLNEETGAFVEFTEGEDGNVLGSQPLTGPTRLGQQMNLILNDIEDYKYYETRIDSPTDAGTLISPLLQTEKAQDISNKETTLINDYWMYRNVSDIGVADGLTDYEELTGDRDIYVIYRKPHEEMGTGTGAGQTELPDLGEPDTSKNVAPNNDGTYDVDLSVTGRSRQNAEHPHANIVIAFDTSNSMRNSRKTDPYGNYGTYWSETRFGFTSEAPLYWDDGTRVPAGLNEDSADALRAVYWRGASGRDALAPYTGERFSTLVGNANEDRLSAAKKAVVSLGNSLLGMNTEDDPEAVQIAFVNFSHMVRNEAQMRTIYTSADTFADMVNNLTTNGGTNWNAALNAADNIYWEDDDPTYIIFVSDGNTVDRSVLGYDENGNPYSGDGWDGHVYAESDLSQHQAQAIADASKIMAQGKTLYTLGVFGDVSKLVELGGTKNFLANNSDDLEAAFADILAAISTDLGYRNVTVNDGLTALTSTTLVNGNPTDFRYYRKGGKTEAGEEKYSSAANDGRGEIWEDAPAAFFLEIDANGNFKKNGSAWTNISDDERDKYLEKYGAGTRTVVWDLVQGDDMLEDRVTYTVAFTVWPSQESYDIIADLNNGIVDYDGLPVSVQNQIVELGGKYYLKTNTNATVDYTSVRTVDGEPTEVKTDSAPIKDPNGKMILDGTKIQMEKNWNDDLDESQLLELLTNYLNENKTDTTYTVTLRLWQDKDSIDKKEEIHTGEYKDGFVYKPEVKISNGKVVSSTWPAISVAIAPGVMVKSTEEKEKIYDSSYPRVKYGSDTYIILETGHSYEITEDDIDLHFELDTDVYHPMVVNGTLKTVKFGDDGEGNRIITEMSQDGTALTTLTATNNLKGGLDIQKFVTTKDDASDIVTSDETFFTFKIKLQKSKTDATPVYTTPGQIGENGNAKSGSLGFRVFAAPVIPSGATDIAEDLMSYKFDGLTYNASTNADGDIVSYIARGIIPETGEIKLKIRQSKLGGTEDNLLDHIRIVNMPAGTYYTVTEIDVPTGYEIVKNEGTFGTVKPNGLGTAKYWNKRTSFTIDLLKVDELDATKKLPDAEFLLYKEDGSTPAADADGKAIGTIKTGTDGKAAIGKLLPGTYKLVETVAPRGYNLMPAPITIIVTNENVKFQQGSKQPMDAEKSSDGLTWTIIATNNPGVELPATGGPGTRLFTILGTALIAGAGILLWMSRKSADFTK